MIRRLCTAVLLAVTFVALPGVAAPALASPLSEKQSRLRAVQARLDAVGVKVSEAVEYYNQPDSRLRTVRAKIKENRKLLVVAERNLQVANRQLMTRAVDVYKARDTGVLDMVLASSSFEELASQYDLMQRLGRSDLDLVRSLTAYRTDIRDRRIALAADERAAQKLVDKRLEQKNRIVALESDLRSMTRGITADIERLEAQQQAAAAAAVAASRQATGSTGSGGGSGAQSQPVDPGGPGHPEVIAIAQRYLGIPYVWGGASPGTGFDCSGLVMYVYAQIGIQLSHGATDQQRASRPVPLSALAPGDLVFYGNASYSYHVAIYVGGGRTIEAARTGTPVRYGVVGSAWIGGRF